MYVVENTSHTVSYERNLWISIHLINELSRNRSLTVCVHKLEIMHQISSLSSSRELISKNINKAGQEISKVIRSDSLGNGNICAMFNIHPEVA